MQLYYPNNLKSLFSQNNLFVDNDFLNALFKNADVFEIFSSQLSPGLLIYDPLTGFEFFRDIYLPEERKTREKFLQLDLFIQATNHQSIFIKIQENALLLSKIIAHSKAGKPGTIDLLLAGRLMTHNQNNHLLITGNLKHFPEQLFDIESRITLGVGDKFFNFGILRFSKTKFEKCYSLMKKAN